MSNKDLSLTFRTFKHLGIIHDEKKYGRISLFSIIGHALKSLKIIICFKMAYKPGIVETIYFNKF